jgi:hypothetical protein
VGTEDTPETTDQTGRHTRQSNSWWPTVIVVGLFLLAAVPMIVTQHDRGRGRFDQLNYHEPAVLRFAEQWPAPDVSDYLSATTPGYHLVLAAVAHYVSDSLVILQLVGSLFTVGLLVVLTRWLSGWVGTVTSTLLGLSVICSLYVFGAGVYILPDNAAWMLVLGILLLSLRPRAGLAFYLGGGGLLLLLILTRQSHLWALGMLLAAGWLGTAFTPTSGGFGEIPALLTTPGRRIGRAGLVVLCALPAIGVLAWFSRVWGGGLTVPIYQDYMRGPNPATPAIILAQLGIIGVFHAGFWWRSGLELVRKRPMVLVAAIGIGLAILLVPATTYDKDAGRYSGLWNIVNKAPDVVSGMASHTNLGVFLLGIGGVIAVAGWLSGLDARSRWVMLGALCGFAAAMAMPKNAWTRYHEPFLLMWSAVASAMIAARSPDRSSPERFVRTLGIAGLCLVLVAVTGLKLTRSERVTEPKWSQKSLDRPLGSLWPEAWLEKWGHLADRPAQDDPGD